MQGTVTVRFCEGSYLDLGKIPDAVSEMKRTPLFTGRQNRGVF